MDMVFRDIPLEKASQLFTEITQPVLPSEPVPVPVHAVKIKAPRKRKLIKPALPKS
jgi:hypothetical protein